MIGGIPVLCWIIALLLVVIVLRVVWTSEGD